MTIDLPSLLCGVAVALFAFDIERGIKKLLGAKKTDTPKPEPAPEVESLAKRYAVAIFGHDRADGSDFIGIIHIQADAPEVAEAVARLRVAMHHPKCRVEASMASLEGHFDRRDPPADPLWSAEEAEAWGGAKGDSNALPH